MSNTLLERQSLFSGSPIVARAEGVYALLLKEAKNCAPMQFLRELVKNGFEANNRYADTYEDPNYKPVVRLEKNSYWSRFGLNKFCIIDNGIGISLEDARKYLGEILHTSKNNEINHGIGARVSTFTRNEYGIEYISITPESYANNEALKFRFRVNKELRRLELVQFPVETDYGTSKEEFVYIPIYLDENKVNPEINRLLISSKHGTQITLLGNSEKDNTLLSPNEYQSVMGSDTDAHWNLHYLNTKFFTLEGDNNLFGFRYTNQESGLVTSQGVKGAKFYLDQSCEKYVSVKLDKCIAHIWMFSNDKKDIDDIRKKYGFKCPNFYSENSFGLFGVIDNHEIFNTLFYKPNKNIKDEELKKSIVKQNMNLAMQLRNCGISAGHERIAIILEPVGLPLQQNASRSELKIWNSYKQTNEDITEYIKEWQNELAANLPDVVYEHIAKFTKEDDDFDKRLAARYLKELSAFNKFNKNKSGEDCIEPKKVKKITALQDFAPPKKKSESEPTVPKPNTFSDNCANKGNKAMDPYKAPTVTWVSDADENYEYLKNKAGQYNRNSNLLELNRNYQPLVDAINFNLKYELFSREIDSNRHALTEFQKIVLEEYAINMAIACKRPYDYHSLNGDSWTGEEKLELGSPVTVSSNAHMALIQSKNNLAKNWPNYVNLKRYYIK